MPLQKQSARKHLKQQQQLCFFHSFCTEINGLKQWREGNKFSWMKLEKWKSFRSSASNGSENDWKNPLAATSNNEPWWLWRKRVREWNPFRVVDVKKFFNFWHFKRKDLGRGWKGNGCRKQSFSQQNHFSISLKL